MQHMRAGGGRAPAARARTSHDVPACSPRKIAPHVARRRVGLSTIVQPRLTRTLGPRLAATSGKPGTAKDKERAVPGKLIDMLPPFDVFRQCFSPALTNWLPCSWTGF